MIDLCVGPHIPHTGRIKAFMVTKVRIYSQHVQNKPATDIYPHFAQNSSSYFLGDAANDSLQRIYGISFPDTKQLTEYKAFLAEAAKRDHRKIGKVRCYFTLNSISRYKHCCLGLGTRTLFLPRAQPWVMFLPASRNENIQYSVGSHEGQYIRPTFPSGSRSKSASRKSTGNAVTKKVNQSFFDAQTPT